MKKVSIKIHKTDRVMGDMEFISNGHWLIGRAWSLERFKFGSEVDALISTGINFNRRISLLDTGDKAVIPKWDDVLNPAKKNDTPLHVTVKGTYSIVYGKPYLARKCMYRIDKKEKFVYVDEKYAPILDAGDCFLDSKNTLGAISVKKDGKIVALVMPVDIK